MRCIDADVLEKEGWSLHRTVRVDSHTMEYQTKPIAKVPTIEPEPQWIPCSERLPEVGTYVLVSKKPLGFRSNLPNVCTAHRSRDPRSGKEEWNDMLFGTLDDDDVLAWMSLPEPWKEGGQE